MKYKIFWEYKVTPHIKNGKTTNRKTVVTTCIIEATSEKKTTFNIAAGISVCRPEDNFSKREGRKKSFTRAVNLINFDKSLRELLWNQLAKQTPKTLIKVR